MQRQVARLLCRAVQLSAVGHGAKNLEEEGGIKAANIKSFS
jgi:hypothetical protein